MNHLSENSSPKRKRLSYACNYCRQKKTRCDEQQPSCQNCQRAGIKCVTTDKRRAGAPVQSRRRAALTVASPALAASDRSSESGAVLTSSVSGARSPRLVPRYWDRRLWTAGRLPMMPRFVGGCMFEVLTGWLQLAFFRMDSPRVPSLPCGISHCPTSCVLAGLPELPPVEEGQSYCRVFQETLYPLFPFLSQKVIADAYEIISKSADMSPMNIGMEDVPMQALSYLILTAGLTTMHGSARAREGLAISYISHCNSLLGPLVADRRIISMQAIVLFAIVIRSFDQTGWAWDVLALAVSMAQSLGINESGRESASVDGCPGGEDKEAAYQTWWCIYVFEKILAFECGRPSMICDRGLSDVRCGTHRGASQTNPLSAIHDYYQTAAISLANVLHEIHERSSRAWHREEGLPQTVEEAINEKINTGGELVMLLEDWKDDFVPGPRCGAAAGMSSMPQSSFLSFYYYYAIILSKRSTLLVDRKQLQDKVDELGRGKPWYRLLSHSAALTVEAAREMIKLLVTIVDSGSLDYLTTLTSPLVATYTLAIHICRGPRTLLNRSDYELMKVGMDLTLRHYQGHPKVDEIRQTMRSLEGYTLECLQGVEDGCVGADRRLSMSSPFASNEPAPNFLDASSVPPTSLECDSAALDWLGWDWNDLSHLFERGE